MAFNVFQTDLNEILPLRNLFLQENKIQLRYNAYHERGWTDSYILMHDNTKIGYGSIKGNENLHDRDAVFEFYLIPSFKNISFLAFSELLRSSNASFIECQSNELLLTSLLYQYGQNINSQVILFEDDTKTGLIIDNIIFRTRCEDDFIFEHKSEPVGDYVLELNNEVVGTGGFLLHYNIPFSDLYMEITEEYRRQGLGSFLIQELKKQSYLVGRVPAARCDIKNIASRATLIKAGLRIAGFMLLGQVKRKK